MLYVDAYCDRCNFALHYDVKAIVWIVTLFTGRYTDLVGPRVVVAIGALFCCLAQMLLSVSTKLWQIYLTQGVLFGIGVGHCIVPPIAMVATWFVKHRGLATGLGVGGTSIGGVR